MAAATKYAFEAVKNVDGTWSATARKDHTVAPSGGTAMTPPAAETMTSIKDVRWAVHSLANLIANDLAENADE